MKLLCTVKDAQYDLSGVWRLTLLSEEGKELEFKLIRKGPYLHIMGHLGVTRWEDVGGCIGRKVQAVPYALDTHRIQYINRVNQETGDVLFLPVPKFRPRSISMDEFRRQSEATMTGILEGASDDVADRIVKLFAELNRDEKCELFAKLIREVINETK